MVYRLTKHPIIDVEEFKKGKRRVTFYFDGKEYQGIEGEVISSALFANGIRVFGYHPKDGAPQGIFCANGQCGQCMVVVNGRPLKACITPLEEGMRIERLKAHPSLLPDDILPQFEDIEEVSTQVLIIGGGPSGLSGAIELGRYNIDTIIIDDKKEPGGKLTLQTHNFFGSISDCWAGTRGIDIAKILYNEVIKYKSVKFWSEATAVGIFFDKKIGVVRKGKYILIKPQVLFIATGAREKTLTFPGADLPGVYGAGAFQTLLNRDLVLPTKRLFIVGGGNVGLIAAYHALQAGIKVVGLAEILPQVGGYKVHLDKIKRLGVKIWTSHTVIRAEGEEELERIIIAQVDSELKPIAGTEKLFEVDTLLIGVGLTPVDDITVKAKEYGIPLFLAGDCKEVAEASAAIFSGKIVGREILKNLGIEVEIPTQWYTTLEELKSKPGEIIYSERKKPFQSKVYPLIHCYQKIPCNPCVEVCPFGSITIKSPSILDLPSFEGKCSGCAQCVMICPGLAILLVDERYDPKKEKVLVTMAWEFDDEILPKDRIVDITDHEGNILGKGKVIEVKRLKGNKRGLIKLEIDYKYRLDIGGFRIQEVEEPLPLERGRVLEEKEDPIICRCERVRKSEIVKEIRSGVRDMNILKATIRTGMGACGGKSCTEQILKIFKEEGVPLEEVTLPTSRPFTMELPLKYFAGVREK